jgi:hypothetical protein
MKNLSACLIALLLCLIPIRSQTQGPLTNDSIIKMSKAGVSETILVSMVKTRPGDYSLGADDVLLLKKEGVTDAVIGAMLHKNSAGTAAPDTSTLANAPSEIGVYIKKGNDWIEVQPEVVNWKTGGVLKNVASLGVVKKDVNGHIDGRASRTRLNAPLEILVIVPDGTAITEYQLLKLNQHSDDREFRTVTGGVFNSKGGATRDMVPFEGSKIAPRTYSITLAGLKRGEYGFLPPTGMPSNVSSTPVGKIYSFGLE